MKTSTEIFTELGRVTGRLRRLNAEAVANEPLRPNRRMSAAEDNENEQRRRRTDQIAIEIGNANAEAARLRRAYAEALESERAPKSNGPSPTLNALYKRRQDCQHRLESYRSERKQHALRAAEGDTKAQASLAISCENQTRAEAELENLVIAVEQAEERDAEERRELADREADEKYRAGLAAGEQLIAWSQKFDNHLEYLAAHFAKLEALQIALRKSGADINTDLTNRLFVTAARDRAAKAAGLHRVFSIDATVSASKLGDAFRALLKSAIRRPQKEGKVA